MKRMLNAMRREAMQAMGERASTRLGTVQSYDAGNYAVRVSIEPEGNLTGWIPVLSPWVGNGWGIFCPPTAGDLVEVQFQEDDHNAALSCMRLFTDANRPLPVPSGEFWLVHKTGSLLKFHNDGTVDLHSQSDLNATVGGNLNATVTGNTVLAVGGNITSNAALWTHTGPLIVNGPITGTAGMQITGLYPGSAYSAIFGGAMQWNAVNITATG